jgi:hypothetical protein
LWTGQVLHGIAAQLRTVAIARFALTLPTFSNRRYLSYSGLGRYGDALKSRYKSAVIAKLSDHSCHHPN